MELYGWQKDCLEKWKENSGRGIAHVVTGAGKTVLALAAVSLLYDSGGLLPPGRLRNQTSGAPQRRDRMPSDRPADGHAQSSRPLHVRIVVPTTALLKQWKATILDFFHGSVSSNQIGLYYGERKDSLPGDMPLSFMLYVVNSARAALPGHIRKDLSEGSGCLLIADECHRYTGDENRLIFSGSKDRLRSPDYYTLGLSATPYCPRYGSVLVPALGPVVYRYTFGDALKDERIVPFHILQISVPFSGEELEEYSDLSDQLSFLYARLMKEYPALAGGGTVHSSGRVTRPGGSSSGRFPAPVSGSPSGFRSGRAAACSPFFPTLSRLAEEEGEGSLPDTYRNLLYKRSHLTQSAQARISCAADIIRSLDPGCSVLVFCERIEQADTIFGQLEMLFPGQTVKYHSGMNRESRKRSLNAYSEQEARILVACRALDEGLNVPDASVGIVLSCTSTSRQRIQRLGRILRRGHGKPAAILYYLYVKQSAEDSLYLPSVSDIPGVRTESLAYDYHDRSFLSERYNNKARMIMKQAQDIRMSKEQLRELRKCLEEGIIRPDWLMTSSWCEKKLSEAATAHERNYWIVMKKMCGQVNIPL